MSNSGKEHRDEIAERAARDADNDRFQYPHNTPLPRDSQLEDNRLYKHTHGAQSKK
jgi:hypothetical protein